MCENLWCDIGGMFPELYRLLLQMIKNILYSCFFFFWAGWFDEQLSAY